MAAPAPRDPWEPFFDDVGPAALRWLLTHGHDEAASREVWQTVVLAVLQSGTPPDLERKPSAYLWAATRREAGRVRRRGPLGIVGESGLAGALDGARTPSEQCEVVEELGRVRDAVRDLPEGFRQVVERRYFAGESVAQIATELEIADNTVATRTHRALRMLAPRLQMLRAAIALQWRTRPLVPTLLTAGVLTLLLGFAVRDAGAGHSSPARPTPPPTLAPEPEPVPIPEDGLFPERGPEYPTAGFPYGDVCVPRPMPGP